MTDKDANQGFHALQSMFHLSWARLPGVTDALWAVTADLEQRAAAHLEKAQEYERTGNNEFARSAAARWDGIRRIAEEYAAALEAAGQSRMEASK